MHILQTFGKTEERYMEKMEKRIQEELFDVEVQYCDSGDCLHDCLQSNNFCNAVTTSLW